MYTEKQFDKIHKRLVKKQIKRDQMMTKKELEEKLIECGIKKENIKLKNNTEKRINITTYISVISQSILCILSVIWSFEINPWLLLLLIPCFTSILSGVIILEYMERL